jgi:arylsulfatase A-like enzyme
MNHAENLRLVVTCLCAWSLAACSREEPRSTLHAAVSGVQHLTDHLGEASLMCAAVPESARDERHWDFDGPRPEWRSIPAEGVALEQQADAMRLKTDEQRAFGVIGLETDLGQLDPAGWETVIVKARTHDRFAGLTVVCNLESGGRAPSPEVFFSSPDAPPIFNDGSVQNYAIPLSFGADGDVPEKLESLAVLFGTLGPSQVDVLSVRLVPRGAAFSEDAGVRQVSRAGFTYRTLFAHAPASLAYPFELKASSSLDFALTVFDGDSVTYRVLAESAGARRVVFQETIDASEEWLPRSVDLSEFPGARVVLEADGERPGAVALWGAPIVSNAEPSERPNVIFYVIDGGDASFMSAFGYEHPTTPFLEKLRLEGVLFTRAHSNATWTQPSTVSFMTSLQHSVLGGLRRGMHSTPVPKGAVTMADHFRRAGYQTASFTANPNAGRMVGIDQGVDVMRDVETEHHSSSSIELHEYFFDWRSAYPGTPYWVHFQTTDVHEPNQPEEPFAGRFVSSEQRERLKGWDARIWESWALFGKTSIAGFYDTAIERAGIDRKAFFGIRRGLYEETMLHQDHALELFVERLKAEGQWENTLLVIGSDHGHPAGTFARFGRGEFVPQPEPWQGAMCDAYATGVPLLVIWPGHIAGGRTIDEPVSMIDVLPTLLDLVELPRPEVCQGQSLAPLLRGEEMTLAPVFLDEFRVDEASGELVGNLEIIHGRWGASLEIGPVPAGNDPSSGRHSVPAGGRWGAVHPFFPEVPRLLLYDLEADPFAKRAVNDEHPDLVKRYTEVLLEQWKAHRALAQLFGDAAEVELGPAQLEQLRAIGYIR